MEENEERITGAMNESNPCSANKRIYNHANNVNLLPHKFYENIFSMMLKKEFNKMNGKHQQHNSKHTHDER